MRRVFGGLVLASVLTGVASAGTILYATGTTPVQGDDQSRIYGYCVNGNGGLSPLPAVAIPTTGQYPRRLLVANGVLYVAEIDRVEAYAIGPAGGLKRLNKTRTIDKMAPHDLAVSEDGTTLYVPRRGQSQIVAYKIGPDGFIFPNPGTGPGGEDDYDSCVGVRTKGQGSRGVQLWESLAVANQRLYVSLANVGTGIRIYPLLSDGSFPSQADGTTKETECRANQDGLLKADERRKLGGPHTFVLANDSLYVQRGGKRRVVRFPLYTDGDKKGLFIHDPADDKVIKPTSHTGGTRLFDDLIVHKSAILGSVFARGRIDSFLLGTDGSLPKKPKKLTSENLVETPHRIRASGNTLYVPGGDLDRIRAYRLQDDGLIASPEPFSETTTIKGSFPNDVIVTTTTGDCR